jgi:hypothetical protein
MIVTKILISSVIFYSMVYSHGYYNYGNRSPSLIEVPPSAAKAANAAFEMVMNSVESPQLPVSKTTMQAAATSSKTLEGPKSTITGGIGGRNIPRSSERPTVTTTTTNTPKETIYLTIKDNSSNSIRESLHEWWLPCITFYTISAFIIV